MSDISLFIRIKNKFNNMQRGSVSHVDAKEVDAVNLAAQLTHSNIAILVPTGRIKDELIKKGAVKELVFTSSKELRGKNYIEGIVLYNGTIYHDHPAMIADLRSIAPLMVWCLLPSLKNINNPLKQTISQGLVGYVDEQ